MAKRFSLSTKIILMVEVILLISSILFCTVSVYRARVGIRMAIQQRMLDIANCASGSISGDILGTLTLADIGSDGYERIYSTLAVFRDNVECEYVYCIRDNGGGSFTFVIDTDPEDPGEFGEAVKYTDALERAARGTASVDEVPYSDAWGEFYSAYSPVFDSAGKETGIIAVDFSADWFDSQLSEQTRSTVGSYAVILLLTLLLAALLSLMTVRPYVRLQGELLEAASLMVKDGGYLTYSTCTLNRKENDRQVASFLGQHPEFELVHEQTIFPYEGGSDGFYIANMHKSMLE